MGQNQGRTTIWFFTATTPPTCEAMSAATFFSF